MLLWTEVFIQTYTSYYYPNEKFKYKKKQDQQFIDQEVEKKQI